MATCLCADPGCPAHIHRACSDRAAETLYRADMTDLTGTPMCEPCAADAYESGLFTDAADNDEDNDTDEGGEA